MASSHSDNHVHNIAIVGAGGQCGTYVTEALLKNGKHHLTAITRTDSKNTIPTGVHAIKKVNYDDAAGLTEALKGQDVLIIFTRAGQPDGSQKKLIDAAATAAVPWVLPNEWGSVDYEDESMCKETLLGDMAKGIRSYILSKGLSYIGISCGFWYEFSLSGSSIRYGFDFQKKEVTFFDDGNTKIGHSTWPQVGRAVASLLSLPVKSEGGGACLEQFRNKSMHIASYTASQKDIFDSVLRVTGTTEKDWKITHEDVKERYKKGMQMMQSGNMMGFGQLLYARVFYPDGCGNYGARHGLSNDILGLPQEDFDESTKLAIKMDEEDYHGFRNPDAGAFGHRFDEKDGDEKFDVKVD